MEIPFEIKKKEPRRLILKLTKSYDFGTYQPLLNGVKLGKPIDLYAATIEVSEFPLMDFWPDPGKYTLRLECVGKAEQSKGHWLGVDSLRLRERRPRVAEYGRDRDKDWRKERKVY